MSNQAVRQNKAWVGRKVSHLNIPCSGEKHVSELVKTHSHNPDTTRSRSSAEIESESSKALQECYIISLYNPPVGKIECFFDAITVMHVDVDVQNPSMVFQKLQDPQDKVIYVAKTGRFALLGMV